MHDKNVNTLTDDQNGLAHIRHLERICHSHSIRHQTGFIRWRELGVGPPLVLFHGGHGSWLHWAKTIEALSTSHRVLVPDLPGYGDSDSLDSDANFPMLVEAITTSIETLLGADTTFDLAGFSFGGVIAGCLAQKHKRIRKLALLGAVGHGTRRRQAGSMLSWRDAESEHALLARMRHNLSVLMLHGPADPMALEIHRRSCIRARFRSKNTSLSTTLTNALERLEMPILMLWGEHDPTCDPYAVGAMWQAGRAERAHVIIAGAGHWVQYEAADEVNQRLRDWFGISG